MHRRRFLCSAAATALPLTASAEGGNQWKLRAGFPTYMFAGLDVHEARAATDVYIKRITEDIGISYSAAVYSESATFLKAIRAGELDFVMISTIDYLQGGDSLNLDPILVIERGAVPQEHYQLMVHKDSGITSLADLKGRTILTDAGEGMELPGTWLASQLTDAGLPALKDYCQLEHPQAVSKAVLPVFFRKKDACLIMESLFGTVAALNPQVSQRLKVLVKSPPLLASVVCLRKGYREKSPGITVRTASNLQNTPAGRQLLTLTRTNRISAFKPEYLNNVRDLLTRLKLPPAAPVSTP